MTETLAGRYQLDRRLDGAPQRTRGRHSRQRGGAPASPREEAAPPGAVCLWQATDTLLDRAVSVRLVDLDEAVRCANGGGDARRGGAAAVDAEVVKDRFWQAVKAAAGLRHPNVVAVHDAGAAEDGRLFLVSEFVDGENLTALGSRRMSVEETTAIGIQVCRALQAAHSVGLPHLRLGPSKVLVARDGGVRVLDFGVSAVLAALTDEAPGPFRAPEQLAGELGTAASDLYALGCLLYVLATGAPPAGVGAAPALRALRADAPPGLEGLLADLLAAAPAGRPADAGEVMYRLAAATWPASSGRHAAEISPFPPLELFLAPTPSRAPADETIRSEERPTPSRNVRNVRPYPDLGTERLAARLEELALIPDAAQRVRSARVLIVELEMLLEADHELVLRAKHRLACWVGESGDEELAVQMMRELGAACRRMLGPTHPDTLTCRHHEAHWTGRAGWPERAVEMLEALEGERRELFGSDDERTLACRHNLAHWTGRSGRGGEAVMLLRELVDDSRRALGDDHASTLAARGELAHWTGVAGDAEDAARICREVLLLRERSLGRDHPATISTLRELERWMARLPQLP